MTAHIILDGAKRLKESIEKYYGNRKIVYITGVFADKAYKQIAEITAPLAQKDIHDYTEQSASINQTKNMQVQ